MLDRILAMIRPSEQERRKRETFSRQAFSGFAERNRAAITKTSELLKEPPFNGISLSTEALLHYYCGEDLKGLRLLDAGCGVGAPIDRVLKQEGVDLTGYDTSPGAFEQHSPELNRTIPQGDQAFLMITDPETLAHTKKFDAIISLRMFGFPLARMQKGGGPTYQDKDAKGEAYDKWITQYDRSRTRQGFLRELERLTQAAKPNAMIIISFDIPLSMSDSSEGEMWQDCIKHEDLQRLGVTPVKDYERRRATSKHTDEEPLQEISTELLLGLRETVILRKI